MTIHDSGELIAARYRLVGWIAGGGMGDVWRATDEVLGREVAVKVLKTEHGQDSSFVERFRFEARAAAGLSHPNIATVFDYGEAADAAGRIRAYIVMELINGEVLSRMLPAQGVPVPTALDLIAQVADGLGAAHAQGIVHRDVKPGNILVRPDGSVKITDFGIARAAGVSDLTMPGSVLGTARYIAPEQLSGGEFGAPADIFALGVVAYQCLTGETPFADREPLAAAYAKVHQEVPRLEAPIPDGVADLVASMLAKEPASRPSAASVSQSARRLAGSAREGAALEEATAALSITDLPGVAAAIAAAPAGAPTLQEAGVPRGGTRLLPKEPPAPKAAEASDMPSAPGTGLGPGRLGKRFGRRRLAMAGIAALAIVVVAAWAAFSGPGQVKVPSLVGMSYSRASAAAAKDGLKVTEQVADFADSPAGEVMAETPKAGVEAKPGSVVKLLVASGKVVVSPSELVGQPYAKAQAILESFGLKTSLVPVISTSTPGDVVAVAPTGQVMIGSSVAIDYAVAPPTTTTTTTAPPQPPGPPGKKHHN
ncbi:MAG: protein kinase [Actinomycetota bacterium]|nr:protein kinase [Actinomycetota bacterium]